MQSRRILQLGNMVSGVVLVFCALLIGAFAYPEGRIVNGTNAIAGEFPSIVSIQYNRRHLCGGTILDATHILTAAHCVYGYPYEQFTVQYGAVNIVNSDATSIKVKDAHHHEEYKQLNGYINDVAVVILEEPIQFSADVQPTVLPPASSDTPNGADAVVAGWGQEETVGSTTADLKKSNLKISSDDDCENAHGDVASRKYHICAGVPEGGRGQCSGDSGGPLLSNDVQLGIVSWSRKPCGIPGYPGVYTKVTNYVDWIKANY